MLHHISITFISYLEVGGGGFHVEGNADELPPPYDPNSAYAKGGAGHSRQPAASAPPLPDNFNVYGQELPPPTYEESVWGEVSKNAVPL